MTSSNLSAMLAWTRLRNGDVAACLALALTIAGMLAYLFRGGAIGSIDSLVEHYPVYHLLGQRIGNGELPVWLPNLASGLPLAADLMSGWFYLPVMLTFPFFSISAAAMLLSASHLMLAGFGTYGLARVLGINPAGATAASIAYLLSGWYSYRSTCCNADLSTASWVPLALLTLELALLAEPGGRRFFWQMAAAFSLAQMVNAWLGPGSYYGVLVVCAYFAYRALIDPHRSLGPGRRLADAARHAVIIGLASLGFAAGGLLPRLAFYRASNLSDGYPASIAVGWDWESLGRQLVADSTWYVGAATLTLALSSLFILRKRYLAPFWMAIVVFGLVMATANDHVIKQVFWTFLPGLEQVGENVPQRVLTMIYLPLAMLAGGVVSELRTFRGNRNTIIGLVGLGAVLLVASEYASGEGIGIPWRLLLPVALVIATLIVAGIPQVRTMKPVSIVLPLLLIGIIGVDLGSNAVRKIEAELDSGRLSRVDLSTYYDPSPAAKWLAGIDGAPFRFAGIDPSLRSDTAVGPLLYGRQHGLEETAELVVNNRAIFSGLEDIQAIDFPVQWAVYDDVMFALNGDVQDYHTAVILNWEALQSPIIDLLNLRYIVVPWIDSDGQPVPEAALAGYVEVWSDANVRILERTERLPRAWLVYDIVEVPEESALDQIASGVVDPAEIALVEFPVPDDIAVGPVPSDDRVEIERDSPERLIATTSSTSSGLLVFSELATPNVRATVDGERVPIIQVNHAFVGVVVPAGDHVVHLYQDDDQVRIGLAISTLALIAVIGIGIWYATAERRNRRHPMRSDREIPRK